MENDDRSSEHGISRAVRSSDEVIVVCAYLASEGMGRCLGSGIEKPTTRSYCPRLFEYSLGPLPYPLRVSC
jgi:hypothetical protein